MKDRVALGWAAVALLVHLAVANRYGFFRDELYFIVCGQHPAFGYADQPPLIPLLAAGAYALGHQLWVVRAVPALASAALVLVTVALARLCGAKSGAAHLAGATVATAPIFLALNGTFNTTVFDPLAWTTVALLFARGALNGDRRALVWAGVVAGVALEAKYYLVVWAAALAFGCAATSWRNVLARREFAVAVAIATLIALPSVIWQAVHGWPFALLVKNAGTKDAAIPPLAFMLGQLLIMNPLAAPVWIAGVIAPFLRADMRNVRALSIAFVVALGATILGHGKDYYIAAAYPVVFAIGAIALERALAPRLRVAYTVLILANAAVVAPGVLPYLPPGAVHGYLAALHALPPQEEKAKLGALPQFFADQFGWPELAATVARVYAALPPADRAKAYVLAGNYGEAAAVDIYDAGLGLPPTLSGHNQYGLWGPHGYDGSVLIDIGGAVAQDLRVCRSATLAATFSAPYVMPYEDNLGIVVCRGLRQPVAQFWERQKFFI
jgi:4-amino-4-deoxy-L-arabinose transferase-like glycosyltransferase